MSNIVIIGVTGLLLLVVIYFIFKFNKKYQKLKQNFYEIKEENLSILSAKEQLSKIELEHDLVLKDLETKHKQELKKAAEDALKTSRNVIKGKVTEELLPFLSSFPYVASDCKFLGSPVDFVVFQNMSENRDGADTEELEIVLVDVKTGKSGLSKIQKRIKEAVEAKRVSWKTLTLNEETGKVEEVVTKSKKVKNE